MASISTYKGASGDTLRAVQFTGADRKRRTIRLGTLPLKEVELIKDKIGLLEVCRKTGQQPNADIAMWLGRIDSGMHGTLAAGGLVDSRDSAKPKGLNLGRFLKATWGSGKRLWPPARSPRARSASKR